MLLDSGKYYMLLNYTQDLYTCKWQGTFGQVYEGGKTYDDDHEFKMTDK